MCTITGMKGYTYPSIDCIHIGEARPQTQAQRLTRTLSTRARTQTPTNSDTHAQTSPTHKHNGSLPLYHSSAIIIRSVAHLISLSLSLFRHSGRRAYHGLPWLRLPVQSRGGSGRSHMGPLPRRHACEQAEKEARVVSCVGVRRRGGIHYIQ